MTDYGLEKFATFSDFVQQVSTPPHHSKHNFIFDGMAVLSSFLGPSSSRGESPFEAAAKALSSPFEAATKATFPLSKFERGYAVKNETVVR